jgi:hypothetical protein
MSSKGQVNDIQVKENANIAKPSKGKRQERSDKSRKSQVRKT